MAKTLTLAGSDFKPRLVSNSARISERLQNQSNTMTCQLAIKSGETMPTEGSEVVFKDGSRFLFGGYLTRIDPVETGEGQLFTYNVEASDYGWILNNKIVRRAYSNQTLKTIVEDILDDYLGSSYSFTTTNVQTGPTVDSVTFDHLSIRRCLEKLSKLTGYVWWVDYEKNLYFQDKEETAAAESITDNSDNFENISLTYDTTQVRNSVIVIGSENGQQGASLVTETFTGDGETRSWELNDKPSQISSITIDDDPQQFSLDLNERDTDDVVYNFNDKRIYLTDSTTTPNGVDVVVTYYPRIPVIVQRQNTTSIATMAALDGGNGIFEYTLKEASITSKAAAIERAEQELEEFADPLVKGLFRTRTGLTSAIFSPGQYLTVNLPTWGISTDTVFLIQQVDIEMIEDEPSGDTEYIYTVRFGGKIVDIETFLLYLAADGEEVQDVDEIKTIFAVVDGAELEDQAPTNATYTPPFEYGAGGNPQGVWNKSEWA